MELMSCPNLAVPNDVMQHVVHVESAYNPYAIGVVGARLARQPRNLPEALATARMLESRGYNFSLGLAQVNRHNLSRYGLDSYERAFDTCANLQAGSRILAECYGRSGGDWGKSFSCYYSGNFTTGFRHGYVQKIFASMRGNAEHQTTPIAIVGKPLREPEPLPQQPDRLSGEPRLTRRVVASASPASVSPVRGHAQSDVEAADRSSDSAPSDRSAAVVAPDPPGDKAFVF